jgi:hypothetical protein
MEDYGSFMHEGEKPLPLIPQLPDAVKFVSLKGKLARQIAHYALHKYDLEFVLETLREINSASSEVVTRALWHIAIITFIKCFVGGSARIRLDEKRIFKGTAMQVFRYFDALRNKHVVHDENSYTQCIPCAALNDGGKSFKIEKIIAVASEGVTLEQANFANLELAAAQALHWVIAKFDELCVAQTAELEKETMEHLRSLPDVTFSLPDIAQIEKRRITP